MGDSKKKTPKKYPLGLSANALRNIDEITGYIAFINHQPANAVKVGDTIFKTIDRIALNPYSFKECEQIPTKTKMYRRAVCLSWIIVYKIMPAGIIVLGIIHKSRKPAMLRAIKRIK